MDAETVADLLGVSTRQIRNYVQAGMPAQKMGRASTFQWPEVREWYIGYRISLESGDRPDPDEDADYEDAEESTGKKEDIRQANLRKTRADANLKELQLSRLRSEVISIADANTRIDRLLGNLRSKLLSLPPKLASRLEGEKSRTDREAALKDELENLCRELATGAIVDLPPESYTVEEIAASAVLNAYSTPTRRLLDESLTDLDILRNLAELLTCEAYDSVER